MFGTTYRSKYAMVYFLVALLVGLVGPLSVKVPQGQRVNLD